jgi:hypothetical protein
MRNPRRWSTRLMAAALGLLLAGCGQSVGSLAPSAGSSAPGFYLDVANLDGPTVRIEINGRVLATVACQLSGAGGPDFTPGADLPLPWQVQVLGPSGQILLSFEERGERGPMTILVRQDSAAELPSEDASGGPKPEGTCQP